MHKSYSDMTGLNVRVVNPDLAPLKGYWAAIDDSQNAGQIWQKVSWNNSLPEGCRMTVLVRANDDRLTLANQPFQLVQNDLPLVDVRGRYIEIRLALIRQDGTQQPLLYDLTLHGTSRSFSTNSILEDVLVYETETAEFIPEVSGPGPMTYQWYVQYPWKRQAISVPDGTNASLGFTNVDSWIDGTYVSVFVSNAAGGTLWLGPAQLWAVPLPLIIPSTNTGITGAASRYPATIEVFDQPTNISNIRVILEDLTHDYPADLDILLVAPGGQQIILMSDAGGNTPVTNATLVFHPALENYPEPPVFPNILPSNTTGNYTPANHGEQETQIPGAPPEPYTGTLDELIGTGPDGTWKLYIHNDRVGGAGVLYKSWRMEFDFEQN